MKGRKMKQVAVWICLCLLIASPSFAACDGGTEITGKNGHVYCKSNVNVNWYTAFSWCDAQGRTLATMEQICDIDDIQRWDGNTGTGKCLNMAGASSENLWVWSAMPYSPTHAFSVYLSSTNVSSGNRMGISYFVLCW